MVSRRLLIGATIVSLLIGALGIAGFIQQRTAECMGLPLVGGGLLPNADLLPSADSPRMPEGWQRGTSGVELRGPAIDGEGFDVDGDGRALQLLGVANYVETPPIAVNPDATYCFSGLALTDSPLRSPTRARIVFTWYTATDAPDPVTATSHWQPVRLWTPEAPPRDWSPLRAAATAPAGATSLTIRIEPASDDRIYLDAMQVRRGGAALQQAPPDGRAATELTAGPWPNGRSAAVSFTFDWETAMGGLVHSRSADDPRADEDYLQRAQRMRNGVQTTLDLFAPYDVQATYFATGYNFLMGNLERRQFLGNPTFPWASAANGWRTDRWTTTPWFADDPFGTIQSDRQWYFGDLIGPLLAEGHTIQSHTFSHFFGGYVDAATWQADLDAWNSVAAEQGVAPATAIAFPWSSSSGISDASWDVIEAAGITAVTRLSDQAQYNLFPSDAEGLVIAPQCRWFPGREERILACPDFYLTERSADLAIRQIDRAIVQEGMIDLWAHTEEVITPEQIAAWERVVRAAAENPAVWVAPFDTIAAWQHGLAAVDIQGLGSAEGSGQTFSVANTGTRNLAGLTLRIPAGTTQVAVNGDLLDNATWSAGDLVIDLAAGRTVEVTLWPAP
jgi:peptidoglycan/xylan/chitin deacetylase (PgdA/CDA1 family)